MSSLLFVVAECFFSTESLELQDLRKAVEEQVGAEAGFLENPGSNKFFFFFSEMSIYQNWCKKTWEFLE